MEMRRIERAGAGSTEFHTAGKGFCSNAIPSSDGRNPAAKDANIALHYRSGAETMHYGNSARDHRIAVSQSPVEVEKMHSGAGQSPRAEM